MTTYEPDVPEPELEDEVLYPAWTERDPITGEVPEPDGIEQRAKPHVFACAIEWAYAPLEDVWGHPPREGGPTQWAIYDAAEDDPPLAVCDDEEMAASIVACLKAYVEMVSRAHETH